MNLSHLLVCLPVVVPLATAVTLMGLANRPRATRTVALLGALLLLGVALTLAYRTVHLGEILVLPIGSWSPLVGIVWVVDPLGAIMLVLGAIIGLSALIYAPSSLRIPREGHFFYPLHQLLMVGINGCFITGDLFKLFVFFEVMLMTSFVQITLGARRVQLESTFTYILINLVGSLMFLAGVGAVYGTIGTVNLAEISLRITNGDAPPAFWGAIGVVLTIFAMKTALVPLFFWLPDSYPEAPWPCASMFAVLWTKVGVYTLFRFVPLITGGPERGPLQDVLLVIAGLTMFFGVLGALGRNRIREILSFHIVSQVGYMIFGLALYTKVGVAAGLFYVVHHIIVKSGLFLAGGIAERVGDSDQLKAVRGLAGTHPWAALGFFIPALALAGIPPFSGFWGKFFLIIAGFQLGLESGTMVSILAWTATVIAILVGLLTLASMLKIWDATYWGPNEGQRRPELGRDRGMLGATLLLASLSVAIGLLAAPLFAYCERASEQLLAVSPYVEAVLQEADRIDGKDTEDLMEVELALGREHWP
ncbi:Na+/H+ antiporter subunit D [soil metagenome]